MQQVFLKKCTFCHVVYFFTILLLFYCTLITTIILFILIFTVYKQNGLNKKKCAPVLEIQGHTLAIY